MYVVLLIMPCFLIFPEKTSRRRRFLITLYYAAFDAVFGRLIGCSRAKIRRNTDCISGMLGRLLPWTPSVDACGRCNF